jgi:hypothetical protein
LLSVSPSRARFTIGSRRERRVMISGPTILKPAQCLLRSLSTENCHHPGRSKQVYHLAVRGRVSLSCSICNCTPHSLPAPDKTVASGGAAYNWCETALSSGPGLITLDCEELFYGRLQAHSQSPLESAALALALSWLRADRQSCLAGQNCQLHYRMNFPNSVVRQVPTTVVLLFRCMADVPVRFHNNCNDKRLTEDQLLCSANVKRKPCGSPTKNCCANLTP